MAAKAEARKDDIEAQYRERKADLDAQEDAVKSEAAAAMRAAAAQAATGAVNAGASIMAAGEGQAGKQAKSQLTKKTGVEGKTDNNAITRQGLQSLDKAVREYPSLEDYWNRVNK